MMLLSSIKEERQHRCLQLNHCTTAICRTKVSKETRPPFTSHGMTLGLAALCRTYAEAPGFLKDGGGTLHKTGTIKHSGAPQPAGICGAQ